MFCFLSWKKSKQNCNAFIILVDQKLSSYFDIFIQSRSKANELCKGTLKPIFEDFCKCVINKQDRLINSGQISNNKALRYLIIKL